jgi:hypothetical protein
MSRKRKTTSPAITDGEQKIAGMKSIDPVLDLGNEVTVAEGETLLIETRAALENYNTSLAVADGLRNVFNEKERELLAFNKKVLPAGGLKFGFDSSEYEKLGGTRDSERKRPIRKAKGQ